MLWLSCFCENVYKLWSKANENIEFGMCDVVAWLVSGTCEAHVTKNAKAALFCKKKKKTLIYRSYNPVKDDIVVHGFIATIARCME